MRASRSEQIGTYLVLGVFAKGDTKDDVVQAATSVAKLQKKATLRIEKEDGELQEERSYPRGTSSTA